jgi:hypothetical protein
MSSPRFTAESIAVWGFDKSDAVDEVLMRPTRKFRLGRSYLMSLFQPAPIPPDIVILKECSAYFPGELAHYRQKMQRWTEQFLASSKQVVLATVVPVTRARAAKDPGKQEALLAYNRWVREYAQQRRVPLLDLEAALRITAPGSYLDELFSDPDGSHLNRAAYAVLDERLRAVLSTISTAASHGEFQAALPR